MACCTGHRENRFFEKISLTPKLSYCCNVSELVTNLNIYENKRVVSVLPRFSKGQGAISKGHF